VIREAVKKEEEYFTVRLTVKYSCFVDTVSKSDVYLFAKAALREAWALQIAILQGDLEQCQWWGEFFVRNQD